MPAPPADRSLDARSVGRRKILRRGGTGLFYIALLALWEILVRALHVSNLVLPGPISVAVALYRGLIKATYLSGLWVTLLEIVIGFGIAALVGTILAVLVVEVRLFEQLFMPLIIALQSLPKVALAPLILIWAGYGIQSKVLVAAMVALFPILSNTVAGLRAYDRQAGELMTVLQASRWQRIWYVKLPTAVPYIAAGWSVAWVFALLGAIVGEFISSSKGLGHTIGQLQYQLDVAGSFAILVILAVIGYLGHLLIETSGRRIAFWNRDAIEAKERQAP